MTEWFTADPHFGHEAIIRHCGRPFANADTMDAVILDLWNSVLRRGDRLYILGDFVGQRRPADYIRSYLDRIRLHPENIFLILGNHDNEAACRKVLWHVHQRYTFKRRIEKGWTQRIVLDHYAMRVWSGSHRGVWHLYGHSHGSLPELPGSLSFDVGVDSNDFRLWSYDDVAARMARKEWRPVDKHGR